MKRFKFQLILGLAVAFAFSLGATAHAQSFSVLHRFNFADGGDPYTPLLLDADGNIYGATAKGGSTAECGGYGCGVAYEVSPEGNRWKETTLFRFINTHSGASPNGSLMFDAAGNLYGADSEGGGGTEECGIASLVGCGLIYKLTPGTGDWTESVLLDFNEYSKGGAAENGPVADALGNLYGTTGWGGTQGCSGTGCGLVYELSPTSTGGWQETILYEFTGGTDGSSPISGVIFDSAGNLYGTTMYGGDQACEDGGGCGVVYELSPTGDGTWQEKVLYAFTGSTDGNMPLGGLVMDGSGNLYGSTVAGGLQGSCSEQGCGVVFELSPSEGSRNFKVLHAFTGGSDGLGPDASFVLDSGGNLYGTAELGGKAGGCGGSGCGVVLKLARSGETWSESVLHTFTGGPDGGWPNDGVTMDSKGNLYGAASVGGNVDDCTQPPVGCGVVFKIVP